MRTLQEKQEHAQREEEQRLKIAARERKVKQERDREIYFRDFAMSKREEEIASYRWGTMGQIRKQTYLEKQREDLANLVKKKPLTSHLLNDVSSRLANADEKFTPYKEREFCPYALRPLVDIRAAERMKKARHPPTFRVATLSAHEKLRFLEAALGLEEELKGEEKEKGKGSFERHSEDDGKGKEEKIGLETVSKPLFRNRVSPQIAQLREDVNRFHTVEKLTEPVFARKILLQEGKVGGKKVKNKIEDDDKSVGEGGGNAHALALEVDAKGSKSKIKFKGRGQTRSVQNRNTRRPTSALVLSLQGDVDKGGHDSTMPAPRPQSAVDAARSRMKSE